MKGTEVNEDVDEGVTIGNGVVVPKFGSLNAEGFGLRIDAFGGSALVVELLVRLALAVELVTDASASSSGHGSDTAASGPLFVIDGTRLVIGLGEEEGTGIATGLVLDEGGFGDVGGLERHSQAGLTKGQAVFIKGAFIVPPLSDKGHRSKAPGLMEVLIDIRRVGGQGLGGPNATNRPPPNRACLFRGTQLSSRS